MEPTPVHRRAPWVCALVLMSCASAAAAERRAAVVLERDDPASRDAAIAAIEQSGGRVIHAFDGLLVVEAPTRAAARLARLRGMRERSETALPSGRARGRSEGFRVGLEAWNRVLRDGALGASGGGRPIPEDPFGGAHAFLPPAPPSGAVAASAALAEGTGRGMLLDRAATPPSSFAPAGAPYGAQPENTSEFLAGRVSVNVVLAESDGTVDAPSENWAADREAAVVTNVAAALDWLVSLESQSKLSFVYHVYPGRTDARARTGYEPIKRAADPNGGSGEGLWVPQILAKLGYASGDRFVRSRAWAHATRLFDGSDWAINVFVVDSLQDADGRFADGYFAYAWVGGPHLVMTYDNGTWGISRLNMVFRHEVLHAFYAFDEYSASACSCTASRGYLNGPGTNCNACNSSAAPCVMIANGDALCDATRRQIGWADLDADGVVDVVGQDPDTFADAVPGVVCGWTTVTGTAAVVAATNLNPMSVTPRASISVARVAGVEVRDDGGAWRPADPIDGAWDEPVEAFSAAISPEGGKRPFEFRARDDYGNSDATPVAFWIPVYPLAAPIPGSMMLAKEGGAATLSWPTTSGAAVYRVYAAASPWGPWSVSAETDGTSWTDPAAAPAYFRVTAVDMCGAEGP